MNTQSKEVIGNMMGVTGLRIQDDSILPLDGVFVAIGSTPITSMIDSLAPEKDSEGCLIVDKRQQTTVP